ncbi:MAG: alpha amylase [Ruminococcaceae bacterium]|nr:alpha amylase [Oscillospiraceae bacterium]
MARGGRILLCLLLILSLLVGCTPTSSDNKPTETTAPVATPEEKLQTKLDYYATLGNSPEDNYRTWYQILVWSFCDSNGDGVGDLQGVISKLDYLETLGVTGIWLLPIHPSSSYHKYDVDDYYAIDPEYGTMEDFDQLIEECDKRGIKVILDLVVNHTSANHPWYTEAVEYLQSVGLGQYGYEDECKYFGYYNFVESESNPGTTYSKVGGTMYHVECDFGANMHDLNWNNPNVREEIKAIMKFWLDKGVGGFRVDAAKHFFTGSVDKNVEVLKWMQETAASIKPDVYMVAEVWETNYTLIARYYESGMTSFFNYPVGNYSGKLMTVVNGRGNPTMAGSWAFALQTCSNAYAEANPNYIDATFISNHDIGRSFDFAGKDEDRVKLAGAMNLFMSGSAFVYYGEEIGMPGGDSDPSRRAPMYWNAERDNGTTALTPGCILPAEGYPLGSYEEQKDDAFSIYNYYRQAIALRNALPVIARGTQSQEDALNVDCISAVRKTWNDEQCLIIINLNDEAGTSDLSGYSDWTLIAGLSVNEEEVTLDGTTLNLPAYGVAILMPK